ncbi:hypothetical protein CTA2_5403 [Colletotrichum tanaceti]|uniref:Uncharacterized protein n=1 Tax=Colletotrichum tanaceti TaxID=1306861 RepID=A0A4U6XEY5_9PEZI|nr:hypothetical protein CTA2_5403 [Colletotrichum tanaceti]TKW54265.1 hypothetical protein CTA1_6448 [Colletotrichum tanaceti]
MAGYNNNNNKRDGGGGSSSGSGGGGNPRPQKPTMEERVEKKRKDFQKAQAELLQAEELHWARAHSLELVAAMPEGPGKESFKRMLRAFKTFPKDKLELVASEGL